MSVQDGLRLPAASATPAAALSQRTSVLYKAKGEKGKRRVLPASMARQRNARRLGRSTSSTVLALGPHGRLRCGAGHGLTLSRGMCSVRCREERQELLLCSTILISIQTKYQILATGSIRDFLSPAS